MFVFPVYSIVFWWFSSKGWDISWHFHMQQHNQTKFSDIHFLHGTVATTSTTTTITPQPPLFTHHCHHHRYHNHHGSLARSFIFTSSIFRFWGKFRTKVSLSHLPLSVPTTHSGKHLSPAMSCACLLLILDEQHVPRKAVFQQAMGQRLADIVSFSFGLSFGTAGWIKKTAKQWFWETLLLKILNAVLNKAWGFPKGIKERAESRAPTLFLPQGKTLFLSPAWRVVTSKSWGKRLICGRAVLEIYSACSANSSIDRPSPHSNAHHQVAPVVKGFCRLPISQTDGECYWMPT